MSFQSDIKLQRNVLLVGVLLMAIKVFAYYQTNSNAILSDALESLVNILGGFFALVSLKIASRPSDANHPYGHGKIEFISGFVEGTLVVVAGVLMVGKAIYNLIYPHEVSELFLGIVLTAGAGAVNYFMGYKLKKEGEVKSSMVMMSEGTHLMSDGYSSLALIIGIAIVWITGLEVLDNVISILFGVYILYTGYKIFRSSIAGIMDELDMNVVEELVSDFNEFRQPAWIDVHNLRVIKFGRDIHIDCHLTLPWYYDLNESHAQVDLFEKLVRKKLNPQAELFIHVDPCVQSSCEVCLVQNCEHRKRKFKEKINWNKMNVLSNHKHIA